MSVPIPADYAAAAQLAESIRAARLAAALLERVGDREHDELASDVRDAVTSLKLLRIDLISGGAATRREVES